MPKPRLVLFDLGKVLLHFDWRIAAQRIAAQARATPEELMAFIASSDVMVRFESGQITSQDFFEEVRAAIGYRASMAEFQHSFSDIFAEIPEMVRLHARVRDAGIPTWIFSNTNDLAITHIRAQFPFFAAFSGYFLSYELGVMKPDAGIYAAAERQTRFSGPDILYIDDLAENVAAGAERGWQVIHHVTPEQTVPAVERLLFG